MENGAGRWSNRFVSEPSDHTNQVRLEPSMEVSEIVLLSDCL
jgi:hypothetical protein